MEMKELNSSLKAKILEEVVAALITKISLINSSEAVAKSKVGNSNTSLILGVVDKDSNSSNQKKTSLKLLMSSSLT